MKINIVLLFFALFIGFSSCEDVFTSVKEIDIPVHNSKLAVFSELSGNQGSFSVSFSENITENNPYVPLNAEITVLENGNPFYKMSFKGTDSKSFQVKNLGKNITEGNEYTLIVENDKYGKATAKQIVPLKPNFSNLKYKKDGYIDGGGVKSDLYSFDIKDDGNAENYYMIEATGYFSKNDTYGNPLYLDSDDPSVKYFWFSSKSGLIITDKNFDGTQTKILIYSSNYNEYEKIKMRLYSITKDYYNFLLSYNQYSNSNDNPFAEPVNVHNNIENGFGMFQANTYREIELDIE